MEVIQEVLLLQLGRIGWHYNDQAGKGLTRLPCSDSHGEVILQTLRGVHLRPVSRRIEL